MPCIYDYVVGDRITVRACGVNVCALQQLFQWPPL